jgi:glutathione peroxidase
MSAKIAYKNVLGEPLVLCCGDPKTGFYRNGFCQTGQQDVGTHVACAIMTDEFLVFTRQQGNDLITPRPEFNFPGLKAGDKWCLCASRWTEALEVGVAPKLVLEATHEKMREYADLEVLKKHAFQAQQKIENPMSKAGAYLFSFTSIDGEPMPLIDFAGQVILVVNTASQCGFTKQYKDLQALFERYKDRGFVVIGVPCNQFGGQEPGSETTIKDFAQKQFGVTFPLTMKAEVSGKNAHPFFKWASDQKKGAFLQSSPKWNFHKFLLDRKGNLVKSYGSHFDPDSAEMTNAIEKLLAEKQ